MTRFDAALAAVAMGDIRGYGNLLDIIDAALAEADSLATD